MTGAAPGPIWAVIPVKGFARGKSRLAGVMEDEARAAFARALFTHVVQAVRSSGVIAGVLVATDDDDVARAAEALGASVQRDDAGATGSLARVVDAALVAVAARGAAGALVLMADLPHLEARDVRELAGALAGAAVVLVADRHVSHTNALALAPPTCLRTCFGNAESFAAHRAAAAAAGLTARVIDNERIAFDVDHPDDHARLAATSEDAP
jgi:2-phospho-L-lactate/phosphoenolpyruvate guanylyltransferase